MNVGFIGLGIMGKPMCANLLSEGIKVFISSSKDKTNRELEENGAVVVESQLQVAENSDVLITMLPNSEDVYEVIMESGLYKSLNPETIIVDMSSITPKMSMEVSDVVSPLGHQYIDAPVSGGEEKAIEGTLSIMAGGDEDAFSKVKPLLEIMSGSITHMGPVGSGNATKLVNQIIVANNIISLSEGMSVARTLGLDLERVYNAISGGLAGSSVMDAKTHRIISGDYSPGFKMKLHMKDLNNVFESLDDNDVNLPVTDKTSEIMNALLDEDMQELDHGALYRYYEKD
ncbi:oxidoreductase [Salinicoccus cyprini]|uniref:6-phosphogluconate dehydrogenase, decarboxylating n=1 Tax=Salinicoccus cyprini TaxID=2493691 RepID=A0A558AXD7_9STAP|nr:NAD(P)-binding domain-containing protein [Salinicoccus cyprini]TVT28919.1 oxidoreductase [Salinicoccus cyprini]